MISEEIRARLDYADTEGQAKAIASQHENDIYFLSSVLAEVLDRVRELEAKQKVMESTLEMHNTRMDMMRAQCSPSVT